MSAAPAYRYDYDSFAYDSYAHDYDFEPRRSRSFEPDISVVPGRRAATNSEPLSASVVFLAKAIAVVLCVIAVFCCGRIALNSAAVAAAIETREVSSQIDSARSDGNQLEVAQSSLSNPTRIKDEAAALGMAAPYDSMTIDLSGDVVKTDASGNLSLNESVAVLANS